MTLWICILAIVISVAVGWRLNLNTGVIAMVFAFFIGYFFLGMSVDQVIAFWPVNIVFYLIAIALFFNYATINGTMEILGKKMLAALGGRRFLVPWSIALVCAVVGGLGAGASTPVIVGPFAFTMALSSGVDPVLTAVCIGFGNLVGSNNPYNGYGGVIGKNLMLENGTDPDLVPGMCSEIWFNCTLMVLIVITVFFLYNVWRERRDRRAGADTAIPGFVPGSRPPAFNREQKITMAILIAAFIFMVGPELLRLWFPSAFWEMLAGICKPQVIMAAAAFLCSVLRLAPEKEVIRQILVSTVVMIAGVYMLIKVAVEAGLVDRIGELLHGSIPAAIVPGVLVIMAAFLSFFSSSTSTVMPLMYPLVPQLTANMGLDPVVLYTCIFFGGLATAVSPFSTGGALTIAGCPDPKVKEELTTKMIGCALFVPVLVVIAAQLGLFSLFR